MVPFVRVDGPLQGHLPATAKPAGPRASGFQVPKELDLKWRDRAACRGASDPEAWFAVGASLSAFQMNADAKAFCAARCPVRAECLRFAFESGTSDGVWGGSDETDRRRARRRVLKAGLETSAANLAAATEQLLAEQVAR